MNQTRGGLFRNPAFLKLWAGQTVSVFGTRITAFALPSAAILAFHADPAQVGMLEACAFVAFPVLGLPAGVWVDRWSRRRVMVVADAVRLFVLAAIPLLYFARALRLEYFFAVALVSGVCGVFFDIAYMAFVTEIVERRALVDGNAKLEMTKSAAEIGGSALAGTLVSFIGAPLTLAVDAFSYAVSLFSLLAIGRISQREADASPPGASFRAQLREGVVLVARHPVLRSVGMATAHFNFGAAMAGATYLIYVYRELHLSPALLGLAFAAGNAGFIGAFYAARIERRLGFLATLVWMLLAGGLAELSVPFAAPLAPFAVIFVVQLLLSFTVPVYNINQVSLRQAITPAELQGRMNATMRTLVWGTLPLGSLVGGALGSALGARPALYVSGLVVLSAAVWLVGLRGIDIEELRA